MGDDLLAATQLADSLSALGAEARVAPSSRDARRAAEKISPHLVLFEIARPVREGLALLEEVRSHGEPDVILLSPHPSRLPRTALRRIGPLMRSPPPLHHLRRAIGKALARPAAGAGKALTRRARGGAR